MRFKLNTIGAMPASLLKNLKPFLLVLLFFAAPLKGIANHIYGIDLYYSWVSGNTYTVYLAVYGDCSSGTFSILPSSTPQINIYNGSSFVSSINLAVQAPSSGIEVTPVCPAEAGHTTCSGTSYTIPGVKKFVYAGNVTLSGTSTQWRFLFSGNMGGSSTAGRIFSITNLAYGSSTPPTIQLVDTLNNVGGPNSSAVYTSIPTPFFCISAPANYNPAAVDPDGNSLVFQLVPGIDAATGASVLYTSPYTPTAPLGVTAGTFSFSSSSGQLSFTPNIVQKSLVVYNVRELSGTTLKGTCQREMCFIILSPCTNNPPTGTMTAASAGSITGTNQLNICNSVDSFQFHLNPTDADGDTINMSVSGLPAGAVFNITNNNTTAPLGTFKWVASAAAPGTYNFFVTYQDHGCPLSSKQTIAYTINILPTPTETVVVVSAATCIRKAVLHITPGGSSSPWAVSVLAGSATLHSFAGVTGMLTDSVDPGTYTIRTTNPVGCGKDTSITLASPPAPNANITITQPICTGGSTGTITVAGTAGTAPYAYAIGASGYSTSGNFTGLWSGTYIIHIVDANGCRKDTAVVVPVTPPILENLLVTKPKCHGFSDGRIIVQAYNSVAPYTYAIGSGSFTSNDTFSALAAGTYVLHIKNANGCTDDTTFILYDSVSLHAAITTSPIYCYGDSSTVTISGTGGYGSYTYALNAGSFGTVTTYSLPAGRDTFHVTDAEACVFDTVFTLYQPTRVSATFALTNVTCNGLANGRIVITATGGTPSYIYKVDAGTFSSSATITGLSATTHTLYVRDANGCLHTDTFTITEPSPLIVDSINKLMPSCYLGSNGALNIFASGGTAGYTYAINSGSYSTSHNFTGLTSASYTLHVKDANGCITDTLVTLPQPTPIVPAVVVINSTCSTLANGTATLSATGGTPGYSFAIGSGTYSASGSFSSLAAGTYMLHIKDANGCIKDTAISITNTYHISATFTITDERCYGDTTGIIVVAGLGGTAAYSYALGTGSYSAADTFNNLSAGTYTVHIQDASGCIADTIVRVTQPDILQPIIAVTSPVCFGQTNGSIAVNAIGGVPTYTYSLNGSAFIYTVAFVGLGAGPDTIVVKDASGCLYDTAVTITQPLPLFVGSVTGTDVSCHGGGDGTITVLGLGGSPAYTYAHDGSVFVTGPTLTGIAAGTHTVHIKDSHGCTTDTSIILNEPAALSFTGITIISPTCEGYKDGTVTVNGAGGIAPYQYSTDNITYNTGNSFPGLAEGSHTFYVRDAHGCVGDTTFSITGYPHILIDTVNTATPSCAGKSDGVIAIKAQNGTPPFKYSIVGNYNQVLPGVFNQLAGGNYTLIITDSNGCRKDTTVNLPEPDTIVITKILSPNDCYGSDNNGGAAVSVTGGTAPYKYMWSNNAGTESVITGQANNDYTVVVTDSHYCTDSATLRIGYDDCCIPYVPNAFSPNNDGKNDIFRVKYKGDIRIIEFSVFNRYGERVFTTSYSEDGWDGTYKGEPSDMGVYYYYVRLLCGNKHNNVLEFKGDVTLVR